MQQDALVKYVLASLGIPNAKIEAAAKLPGDETADLVITAEGQTYLVEIKSGLPTKETVARLTLLRALFEHAHSRARVTPILVTRSAPPGVRDLLEAIGAQLIEAPPSLLPATEPTKGTAPLTTEKSWNVFTTLLRIRAVKGVRPLAQESGVSAGWAHRTLNELVARGIARKGAEGIFLEDPSKILDAAAFERPLKKLETEVIPTDYANAHEAAVELTRILDRDRPDTTPIAFAFGGHTAAGLHTGYAHRHDRVDLYVDDPDFRPHVAGPGTGRGIRVHVLKPDRDVTTTSQLVEGVRVVSRDIALLDMAGLGYAGRDAALKLLESYGSRHRA